jgi:hypothetical protein
MAVAAEEFAEAQRLSGMERAHQDHIALSAADQRQAAQDESAHGDFAEFGILSDERAKGVGRQLDEFAGLGDPPEHQAAMAGDHGHFAGEAARPVRRDHTLAGKAGLHDFHGAGKQDEETGRWCRRA